jgi:thiosulfate/3-mercaptopyruvate sulfurtransferase
MKRVIQALAATIVAAVLLGCGPAPAGEKGTAIVDAATALELLADGNAVLVDANKAVTYQKRHAEGAVNIPRPAIVVNEPVPESSGHRHRRLNK